MIEVFFMVFFDGCFRLLIYTNTFLILTIPPESRMMRNSLENVVISWTLFVVATITIMM